MKPSPNKQYRARWVVAGDALWNTKRGGIYDPVRIDFPCVFRSKEKCNFSGKCTGFSIVLRIPKPDMSPWDSNVCGWRVKLIPTKKQSVSKRR